MPGRRFRATVSAVVVFGLLISDLGGAGRSPVPRVEAAPPPIEAPAAPVTGSSPDESRVRPIATDGVWVGEPLDSSTPDERVMLEPPVVDQPHRSLKEIDDATRQRFPESKVTGYDEQSSSEIVDQRDRFSSTFHNADGTESMVLSSQPVHFQEPDGSWGVVDSRLVADASRPGEFATAANDIELRVRPGGVQFTGTQGEVVLESVPGGSMGEPVVSDDGLTVTYREVWPGVDLRYVASAGGVRKEIVLNRPGTQSSFDVTVAGVDVGVGKGGELTVRGKGADTMSIGQVIVFDKSGVPVGASAKALQAAVPASAEMVADAVGQTRGALPVERVGSVISYGVDPAWLASLDPSAFPVVIDPSWNYWSVRYNSVMVDGSVCAPATCSNSRSGRIQWGDGSWHNWRSSFAYRVCDVVPDGNGRLGGVLVDRDGELRRWYDGGQAGVFAVGFGDGVVRRAGRQLCRGMEPGDQLDFGWQLVGRFGLESFV